MKACYSLHLLFVSGQSFFDHQTGEFVSCFVFDFTMSGIDQLLDEVQINELGSLTLVRGDDDGTVVASPYFDFSTASETTTVDDPALRTVVDQVMFDEMKSCVDFSKEWSPEEASKAFETKVYETEDYLITSYPIPTIPNEYDPLYSPIFYAIFTLSKTEGFAAINEQLNDARSSLLVCSSFEVDEQSRGAGSGQLWASLER